MISMMMFCSLPVTRLNLDKGVHGAGTEFYNVFVIEN